MSRGQVSRTCTRLLISVAGTGLRACTRHRLESDPPRPGEEIDRERSGHAAARRVVLEKVFARAGEIRFPNEPGFAFVLLDPERQPRRPAVRVEPLHSENAPARFRKDSTLSTGPRRPRPLQPATQAP